jgi:hypothetical protein
MNNEELAYVSSSPLLDTAPVEISSVDEDNIDTLEAVFKVIKERKDFYQTILALEENSTTFTVKEQLATNKRVVQVLGELESLLAGAISKVKEQGNGR